MSNPYIDAWSQSGGIELPPIGQVDEEEGPTNPYLQAWQESQAGMGRGLLTGAQSHEERVAGSLAIAGGIVSGLIKPFSALAGLPGAIGRGVGFIPDSERIVTDKIAETIDHWNDRQLNEWESRALELGFSEEELRGTRMLGEILGFIAPGVATYKGAMALSRVSAEGIVRAPFMAGLKVDIVAGTIWGGALTEGELSDRLKNAAIDGGLSGAMGLALTGAWPAMVAYRNTRLAYKHIDGLHQEQKRNLLGNFYQRKRAGELGAAGDMVVPTAPEARGLFEQMSEESFIINSPAAQDILARNADESALVQAITDVAGAKGSGGVVKQIADDFPSAVVIGDKFRSQFPGLKFNEMKNPEGGFDIIFGTKGLNNKQKKQYPIEGRYAGQRVQHADGTEYEYVRKLDDDLVLLKRLDTGNEARVQLSNISDMPYGIEPGLRSPVDDALFQDFDGFFRENSAAVLNERYSLSESDMVRLAREGRLSDEILGRRRVSEPNAVTMPEETGGGFRAVREIAEGEGDLENFFPYSIVDPQGNPVGSVNIELVNGNTLLIHDISAGPSGAAGKLVGQAGTPGFLGPGNVRRLLDQVVSEFEAQGVQISRVAGQRISGARAAGVDPDGIAPDIPWVDIPIPARIRQSGTEDTWVLHPWEDVSFEDTVRLWAQDRGLPTEGAEFISLQADFAARARQNILEKFNADFPEDAAILHNLRNEWEKIINAEGLGLEARAAVKGFHLDKIPGAGYRLRDINTGAGFEFVDLEGVEQAVARAVRGDRSVGEFGLPPDVIPQVMSPSAVPVTPIEQFIDELPEDALHIKLLEDIPTRSTTNTRDLLLKYEDRTQIPLWKMGFSKIDEGAVQASHEFTRWGRDIDNARTANKVGNRQHRVKIGEYLTEAEGRGIARGERLKPTERYALAKEMGLSEQDYQATKELRRIFDAGFEEYGIEAGSYIEDYFGRILPYARQHGVVSEESFQAIFPRGLPSHLKHFAEFERTGVLSNYEMDPWMVAHKWFRAAAMKRHVDEPYNFLARAIRMEVRDLPKEQRIRLEKGAQRRLEDHEKVIAEPIGDIIKEYLNAIRGAPVSSVKGVQTFFGKIYKKLGIEVDEKITTEFFNTMLATMYGSAMGMRPMLIARNHLQTSWNLYTRLGSKHFGKSMEDAISLEGFQKAMDAMAIRTPMGGIPMNDHIFEELIEEGATGTHAFGRAAASVMNKSLSAGRLSRKVAEKSLVPYGAGDSLSRAWAFHYQRRHTADLLEQHTRRRNPISWEKFLEDGLPFYDRAVREEFAQRLRYQSSENALDFIGKMAADETHFIYGMGNQPAWMQNPFGKFMGMFGTWPLWQKEVYSRIARNGTRGQKTAAMARTAALGGAVGLVGYAAGANMMNWMAPAFITWTGGPGVDHAINLKRVIDAPVDQKAAALGNFAGQFARLSFPGQVLMNDIAAATSATDDPAMQALYMMIGRPTDTHFMDIELEAFPPTLPKRTAGASTSAEPRSYSDARDFSIDLQSLGLEPQVQGAGSREVITQTPYGEILQYLGGNVPR